MKNLFEKTMQVIRDAVEKEYGGNIRQASQAWGLTSNSLYKWLDGSREPSLKAITPILENLGARIVLPTEDDKTLKDEYVMVPKVKAVAGAGASFVVDDTCTGLYAFRREFLRREYINTADLVMMMVSGDSMEPLIRDGDTVLVDQTDNAPADGKIYVLRIDDALMVKRMEKIPGGWRVKSDNPDRGHYDLRGDELESLHVFGRVRWFGRVV